MDFTPQESRFLQNLGRTEQGRDLVKILNRAKDYYSSISSIDGSKDYGAQVEGRKLFGEFVKNLTQTIETQKHRVRPLEQDDYT